MYKDADHPPDFGAGAFIYPSLSGVKSNERVERVV
jgi:hypothetical protein